MQEHRLDREAKGHFRYPCAGSIFKNDRSFGEPTGKIIDSLGLKGLRIGDAQVSELHGNIIVNRGSARAAEVLELVQLIEARVREARGFRLEREVRLVGQW
jgi:UDP-N-acetylmuramate dehydrogenase